MHFRQPANNHRVMHKCTAFPSSYFLRLLLNYLIEREQPQKKMFKQCTVYKACGLVQAATASDLVTRPKSVGSEIDNVQSIQSYVLGTFEK